MIDSVISERSAGALAGWRVGLAAALLPVILAGCSGGVDSQLQAYVEEINARPAKPLPPLDPPQPYVVFTYEGEGVDPFQPFFEEQEQEQVVDDTNSEFAPIAGRLKEELEQFPLDALRMVGTLEQGPEVWGIVLNRDGTVYRVQVGNYMGHNHGKIIAILEDRIELEERAKDIQGKWQLREASLALVE